MKTTLPECFPWKQNTVVLRGLYQNSITALYRESDTRFSALSFHESVRYPPKISCLLLSSSGADCTVYILLWKAKMFRYRSSLSET
jgi:hypothetical protein